MKKIYKKHQNKLNIAMVILVIAVFLSATFTASAGYRYPSEAEANRSIELGMQGYSLPVAQDQAAEEFGFEGVWKTGGIDGKLLDGTVAPNNQLGLPTGTTTKTTCTHDWVETDRVEPTCQTEGEVTYECSKCGKTKTETLQKAEHDYVLTENITGTCQEIARQTYTCSVCGETYTVDGELGEHIYVKSADSVEPACETDGKYIYVCSVCGDTYEETVPALGHEFSKEKKTTKEPTCTEDGVKAYVCERCGITKDEETVPALGHTKSEVAVVKEPATFWKDGAEEYHCIKCNEVLETVIIPATGGVWRFIIPFIPFIGFGAGFVAYKITMKKK